MEILLQEAESEGWAAGVPRRVLVDSVRAAVEDARGRLLESSARQMPTWPALRRTILADARQRVQSAIGPHYRKVINATGIILHTALGRAVLPAKALRQIASGADRATRCSRPTLPAASGRGATRGSNGCLQQLTGAEAATVVNNNAAATSIVLNTVACGKEVIVSRGQLVEIGGSFRLPDVMAASGAKLVEVGTTNKTHARDYEKAITPEHGRHPPRASEQLQDFRVHGRGAAGGTGARSATPRGIVVIDDVGAGPLVDFSRFGFDKEPTLQESVQAGADLITASADKLIGASQGGIILGQADLIQAIRKNPLARIVRVGKLTLAALEATLSLFLDEAAGASGGAHAADALAGAWRKSPPRPIASPQAIGRAGVRGGRDHGRGLFADGQRFAADAEPAPRGWWRSGRNRWRRASLAARLRRGAPPVFARVHKGEVLVDPRTLLEGEEEVLVESLVRALQSP